MATHRTSVDAFTVGEPASLGVKEIAENGNLGPFISSLQGASGVSEVVEGTFPLVPAGTPSAEMFPDGVTFEIHATADARRLSWVSMLICTNDGFTGADGLKLPVHVGAERDGRDGPGTPGPRSTPRTSPASCRLARA